MLQFVSKNRKGPSSEWSYFYFQLRYGEMKNMDKKKKKKKKERFYGIDLIRVLAILIMISIHVTESAYDFIGEDTFAIYHSPWAYFHFLGNVWAQPVFMACMGILMIYSSKSDPKKQLKRGFILFGSAYILNLVRFIYPIIAFDFPEKNYTDIVLSIFAGDILQLAGLSFILIASFRKLKLKPGIIFVIALGMSAIGTFLQINFPIAEVEEGDVIGTFIGALQGIFVYFSVDLSCFPLLNHFVFPACGYFWGEMYKNSTNKKRFNIISLMGGIICYVGAIVASNLLNLENVMISYNTFKEIGFDASLERIYGITIWSNIASISLVVVLISICNLVTQNVTVEIASKSRLWKGISYISKNLTIIYIIQWLLIGNMEPFIAEFVCKETNYILYTLGIAVFMIVLTNLLMYEYNKMRHKKVISRFFKNI